MKYLKTYSITAIVLFSILSINAIHIDSLSTQKNNLVEENIPKSCADSPLNIIITFCLSLIVALISVSAAHYFSTIKRRKNLIKTYRFMIMELINASNNQSENFNKIINLLEEEKSYINYPLGANSSFSLNSLNKLPLDLILEKIISNNKKSEIFANFQKKLNILDIISNRYLVNHDTMIEKFNQYTKEWNYNVNKIREIFDSYRHSLRSQGVYARGNDSFFDSLDLIFYNYINLPNHLDYYTSIEYLIKPIKKLCNDNTENRAILPILNHILGCESAFANFVEAKITFSNLYSGYINKINEATDFLQQSLNDVFS